MLSRLSPKWLCGCSCTWPHHVRSIFPSVQVHELPQSHCVDNWEGNHCFHDCIYLCISTSISISIEICVFCILLFLIYIYIYIYIYIIGLLALAIYFGRKNNLSSANKLPKKILIWDWQKNAALRILGSALATYILYVLCCTLWFYITWVTSFHGMIVYYTSLLDSSSEMF